MKIRELAALLMAALALGILSLSLVNVIAAFLPGAVESLERSLKIVGGEGLPPMMASPLFSAAVMLTCQTPFSFFFGVLAWVLWRGAGRERETDSQRRLELLEWGASALEFWLQALIDASEIGDGKLASEIERARRQTSPHLRGMTRSLFEHFLLQLEGHPPQDLDSTAPVPARGAGRWPRVCINVLWVFSVAQIGIAFLNTLVLTIFDDLPLSGIPLGPSAAFMGVSTWVIGAGVCAFLAIGLSRLRERTEGIAERARVASSEATDRIVESLRDLVSTASRRSDWSRGAPSHRVLSAFATATLGAIPAPRRREAIDRLWRARLLGPASALDLRGARLRSLDLAGVRWSGIHLEGVDLEATSFQGADLKGSSFRNSGLRDCNFHRADLSEACLRGADLTGAGLQRADLSQTDLAEARLWNARLWGVDLDSANLQAASILESQRRDLADQGFRGQPQLASPPADIPGAVRSSNKRPAAFNLRLELWSLLFLHAAVLFQSGVSYIFALGIAASASWVQMEPTPNERIAFSPVGLVLGSGIFLIVSAAFLALAWAFRRLAARS